MSLIIILPWTTHYQHQKNNQNQKSFKNQNFNNNFVQKEVIFLKVRNTLLYTNQKETSQETS
jgi:hypothetical protein